MKLQQKSTKIVLGFVLLTSGLALLRAAGSDGSGAIGTAASLLCTTGIIALLAGSWPKPLHVEITKAKEDK